MVVEKEFKKFKVRLIGSSRDLRTNRWELTCKKCNKSHEPETTLLALQHIECPKCNEDETINYNLIR
jgi:Zn finger protein HypA/HybF involved in hydrogenase expression